MHPTLAEGIDPGLVHTGVVQMLFVPDIKRIVVQSTPIVGPDARATATWLRQHRPVTSATPAHTYIEGYRPRSAYDTDAEMAKAVQNMRAEMPKATVLMNTGVKKVVKRPLMELLGVWKFNTPSHHQDLRSAARIALLGMLKQEPLNRLVTTIVIDHLEGRTWDVSHS